MMRTPNAKSNARPEIDLLDVNVWQALADENHVHPNRAAMNNLPFRTLPEVSWIGELDDFGCRLVSFDGGYRKFQPLDFLHLSA